MNHDGRGYEKHIAAPISPTRGRGGKERKKKTHQLKDKIPDLQEKDTDGTSILGQKRLFTKHINNLEESL